MPPATTAPIDDYAAQLATANATKQSLTSTVGGRILIAPEMDPKNGALISATVANSVHMINNISKTDAQGIIAALAKIHGL